MCIRDRCGAIASGCICYTISPIHNLESYVKLAKEIEALGVQAICGKDMAGIMSPKEAFDRVTALKKEVKGPIEMCIRDSLYFTQDLQFQA